MNFNKQYVDKRALQVKCCVKKKDIKVNKIEITIVHFFQ